MEIGDQPEAVAEVGGTCRLKALEGGEADVPGDVPDAGRAADKAQPRARAGSETPAGGRGSDNVSPAGATAVSSSTDAAARSLGRELMAEARLAYVEHCLDRKRSRRESDHLKTELVAAREEQARARDEAERHRAGLAAGGAAEPPYLLTRDERSRLRLLSRHVPEHLRERADREVARARLIADGAEAGVTKEDERVSRVEGSRATQADPGHRPAVAVTGRTSDALEPRRGGPARAGVEPPPASTAPPAESRGVAVGKPPAGGEARQATSENVSAKAGVAARQRQAAQEILHARGREAVEFYNSLEAQAGSFRARVRATESHTAGRGRRDALEKGYEIEFGEKPPAGALISARDRQYVLDNPRGLVGAPAGVREASVSAVLGAGVSPLAVDYIPKEKYEQRERDRGRDRGTDSPSRGR